MMWFFYLMMRLLDSVAMGPFGGGRGSGGTSPMHAPEGPRHSLNVTSLASPVAPTPFQKPVTPMAAPRPGAPAPWRSPGPFRLFLALGFVAVVTVLPWRVGWADTVVCLNCGTETTQLAAKVQLLQQVQNSTQQLQAELNHYQNAVANSQTVPNHIWGNAARDIQQLTLLMQQGVGLAGSASAINQQFNQHYGSYQTYTRGGMSPQQWDSKYAQWSNDTQRAVATAMQALGVDAAMGLDEEQVMGQLQAMAQTAQGRMQAIQVGVMMAAQQVRQLQKLRALMGLQLQTQASFMAAQQDRQAAADAARREFFRKRLAVPTRDGRRF